MSRVPLQRWILRLAVTLPVLLLCSSRPAHAQIGSGSLRFTIDGHTALNGYNDGGTANPIVLGTQLTGTLQVIGVTGNGGTTTVKCYANSVQILSWSTTTDATHSVSWQPTAVGTYPLYCSGTWFGQHANGTVSTPIINIPVTYTSVSGYINPKYVVLGVDYVTPGAASTTQYCRNNAVSTTNSITNTFMTGFQSSLSVQLGGSIFGYLGGNKTTTFSNNFTQTTGTSKSVVIGESSSSCITVPGPTNNFQPNNHDYDVIWVWLNPVAVLTFMVNNGTVVSTQWNGWGYNAKDQNSMEVVPVTVGCLNGDLQGCTILTRLNRTWDTGETWPSGKGPALTAQDYTNILNADPFAHCEPGTPLTQQCSVTPNPNRFTITDNQDISYFQPPAGAQPITTTYMLGYSVSDTEGRSYTISNGTTFGVESEFGVGFGGYVKITAGSSQTFTTTTQSDQSLMTSNGTTSTASITGPPCTVVGGTCSPLYPSITYPGPTEFDIYEDTLFGTFLYYPVTWQN